jgi:hypothetical protein
METKVMQINQIAKVPTLSELVSDSIERINSNNLMVLLNQEPPKEWIKKHPTTQGDYLPIERVEYLLSRIFTRWWVDVKQVYTIANSVAVSVRLFVVNPLDGNEMWQDGLGASPIQTEKGAGAMDWNKAKSAGVQMAAPIAESFAIKDAAEKFGKLFGKDLNRKDQINYNSLLKVQEDPEEKRMIELVNNCKTISAVDKLQQANPNFNIDIFTKRKEALNAQ